MAAPSLHLIFKAAATQGGCCPGARAGEEILSPASVPKLCRVWPRALLKEAGLALLCARLGTVDPGSGCSPWCLEAVLPQHLLPAPSPFRLPGWSRPGWC